MSRVDIDLKSWRPGGVDAPQHRRVTLVRGTIKIRFVPFMDPEIVEDAIDLMIAKRALTDPANRRIPWEQVKRELGL
jgi:hypothetical protein